MCMSVSGYIVYLQVYILMSVSEYVCLQVYTCMNVCRCVYLQVYMCMSVSGYDVYLEVYRRMNVSGYVCFQVYLCSVCIDLSVFAEAHVCAWVCTDVCRFIGTHVYSVNDVCVCSRIYLWVCMGVHAFAQRSEITFSVCPSLPAWNLPRRWVWQGRKNKRSVRLPLSIRLQECATMPGFGCGF